MNHFGEIIHDATKINGTKCILERTSPGLGRGIPEGVVPVTDFDLERYQGKWYEIARLDHSFERGLEQVSAEYSLQENGEVTVVNRGFSPETGEWKEAVGKARFVDSADKGHLVVSFFGPFYSSYVVFHLDRERYEYAFVTGPTKKYLWLLARTPQVESEIVDIFREKSGELGFRTEELIYVRHDETPGMRKDKNQPEAP